MKLAELLRQAAEKQTSPRTLCMVRAGWGGYARYKLEVYGRCSGMSQISFLSTSQSSYAAVRLTVNT